MYSLPRRGVFETPQQASQAYTAPADIKPSNPDQPYDDDTFATNADIWFFNYLIPENEAGYQIEDPRGADPSVRLLRGEGPAQAGQLYLRALSMNFSPEIHDYMVELLEFFHAFAQAGAEFSEFEKEKILPTTLTKGKPEYERASEWYQAAQKAIKRSKLDQQGVYLPPFIGFDAAYSISPGYDPVTHLALTPNLMNKPKMVF